MLARQELIDTEAGDGGQVGDRDDLAVGVALDDDLAVAEAAQAEVVRRAEELHAREDSPQAGDDAHPPARVQVRTELVDEHRSSAASTLGHCWRREIIRSVASATTDW